MAHTVLRFLEGSCGSPLKAQRPTAGMRTRWYVSFRTTREEGQHANRFSYTGHVTKSVIAKTDALESAQAGRILGRQMSELLSGEPPDAVILFASAIYDYSALLKEVLAECSPKLLVGCSSAGEFTGATPTGASACAVAIRSSELAFSVGLGREIAKDGLLRRRKW